MVGNKRKTSHLGIFSEAFFIENPLNGINIQAMKRFVGVGTDADSGIKF